MFVIYLSIKKKQPLNDCFGSQIITKYRQYQRYCRLAMRQACPSYQPMTQRYRTRRD